MRSYIEALKHKTRWIHTTVFAALFTGLTSLGALARDIAQIPPHTLDGLESNLKIAASDRAASRFAEIVLPFMSAQEKSGLVLIGAAEDHEVESARHFALFLKQTLNLRLVLLSSWGQMHVPGFDGIVVDPAGRPVANFSMKTVSSSIPEKVLRTSRYAFSKIRRYSDFDGWMAVLTNQMNIPQSLAGRAHLTEHQAHVLYRVYHELADMISVLNIGGGRPEWVLVDTGNDSHFKFKQAHELNNEMPADITGDPNKLLLVRGRRKFFAFHRGELGVYRSEGNCESLLH